MTRIWIGMLLLMVAAASAVGQVADIAEVKQIDANGRPLKLGQMVTVGGVVTVPSGVFSQEAADLDAYIQDRTGGINIYTRSLPGLRLKLGDSVVVTGTINVGGASPNAGTCRLRIQSLGDLSVVGRAGLPGPLFLTARQLSARATPPLEPKEGILVRMEEITIESGTWPSAPGTDTELTCRDSSGTFKIHIDGDTDVGGTDRPEEPFVLIGVVVQNSAYPYLSGYEMWPRFREDDFLIMGNGSGIATLDPAQVENDLESFDLALTLAGNGRDTIISFSVELPLADGWGWPGGDQDLAISGPGLSQAWFQLTDTGVVVDGAAIYDAQESPGTVTFKNMSPPPGLVSSQVIVTTSVDGVSSGPIARQPVLESVFPKPDVVINEIYPNDGTTSASNAFVELHNRSSFPAFLEKFALCEPTAASYCNIEVRHVFGADTIPPGGYLVIAKSSAGFSQRFGFQPDVIAPIKPLGRLDGDGAICGSGQLYEVISLWRDATLTDLVDYREYRDGLGCEADVCQGFGTNNDAFPYLPPVDYALVAGDFDPCCPYQVLTSTPTPGASNVIAYRRPRVDKRLSYETNTVEITFSEPMERPLLEETVHYEIDGAHPEGAVASISGEKVLLLWEHLQPGLVSLRVSGLESMPGQAIRDSSYGLSVSSTFCIPMCGLQSYDSDGFSPYRDSTVCLLGFITLPPGVFQPDYSSIYVQGIDGCGVNVFSYDVPSPRPRIGDFVYVTGDVEEYVSSGGAGSTTELFMNSAAGLTILSRNYPQPAPLVLGTGDITREEYEGRLVRSEGAIISTSDYDFYIDDGTGGVQVYQNYTSIDFAQFTVGMYVRVTGVVLQYDYTRPYLEGYELVPRYESDIEIIEDAFPSSALLKVDARVFCPSCGDPAFDITFGGRASSNLVLRLFDAGGRTVATLYDGLSAGETVIGWDGRDSRGEMVPPGLYICYLEVVEAVSGKRSTESVPIVVGMKLK